LTHSKSEYTVLINLYYLLYTAAKFHTISGLPLKSVVFSCNVQQMPCLVVYKIN